MNKSKTINRKTFSKSVAHITALGLALLLSGCGARAENAVEVHSSVPERRASAAVTQSIPSTVRRIRVDLSPALPEPDAAQVPPLYTQSDAELLAKLLLRECGGVSSDTQKACVAWTVLNRADAWNMGISEVITSPNQYAHCTDATVDEALLALATDVLDRWSAEKSGAADVGRVLPPEYMWFWGDGTRNHFRDAYSGAFRIWDYSLPSPYES